MSKEEIKYTDSEVQALLKSAISCTIKGVSDWYESENTWIVDKSTQQKIDDCELTSNPNVSPLQHYIIPLLKEKGIELNVDNVL